MEQKLIDFCQGLIGSLGYRTVDLDCQLSGRSTVRLFIETDKPRGESSDAAQGVSLGDCVKVTEILSPALDTEQIFSGPYDLEVSSPGLDRRLRLRSDFEACVGEEVKLRFYTPVEGLGSQTRAKVLQIQGESLKLKVDQKEVSVLLSNIKRGNLIWEG